MKKIFAIMIMALAVSSLSSCIRKASDVFADEKGSLKPITKTIRVEDFNKITVYGGALEVYYTQSDTTSLRVEVPERYQNRVGIKNEDGKLTISYESGAVSNRRYVSMAGGTSSQGGPLKVYVSSKTLRKVSISGAGDFYCKQPLQTDRLDMSISGAGDIEFSDVTAKRVEASIAGAGDITLLARKADIDLSIAGAGDIVGTLVDCGNVTTSIAGAGDITLKGNAKHADNTATGGATIDITGLNIADRK